MANQNKPQENNISATYNSTNNETYKSYKDSYLYDSSNNEDSGAESSDPVTYRNTNLLKGNRSNKIAKKITDRSGKSPHSSHASSLDENIDIDEAFDFPKGSLSPFTPFTDMIT